MRNGKNSKGNKMSGISIHRYRITRKVNDCNVLIKRWRLANWVKIRPYCLLPASSTLQRSLYIYTERLRVILIRVCKQAWVTVVVPKKADAVPKSEGKRGENPEALVSLSVCVPNVDAADVIKQLVVNLSWPMTGSGTQNKWWFQSALSKSR